MKYYLVNRTQELNQWDKAPRIIEEVEVVRETPSTLVILEKTWDGNDTRERRVKKANWSGHYFSTYDEAYQFALQRAQHNAKLAQEHLNDAHLFLKYVEDWGKD